MEDMQTDSGTCSITYYGKVSHVNDITHYLYIANNCVSEYTI